MSSTAPSLDPHPPLSQRLRSATAEVHRRLESSLDLLRPDFSLPDYRRLLRAFYGYLQPWEQALARSPGPGAGAPEPGLRRHVPRLLADLQHFGERVQDIPLSASLPAMRSHGARIGSRYVIEGSMLGGRVIVAHLQRRLPVDAGRGARYFAGDGERTGAAWRDFCRLLDALPAARHDDALRGALDTFETLAAWLRRCGVAR